MPAIQQAHQNTCRQAPGPGLEGGWGGVGVGEERGRLEGVGGGQSILSTVQNATGAMSVFRPKHCRDMSYCNAMKNTHKGWGRYPDRPDTRSMLAQNSFARFE